jgi:hypothetical protein
VVGCTYSLCDKWLYWLFDSKQEGELEVPLQDCGIDLSRPEHQYLLP